MNKKKIIFFGNGRLAEVVSSVILARDDIELVFWAKTKEDLIEVEKIAGEMKVRGEVFFGVLASYGQILRENILKLFEPVGILNVHPSLLPKYRGPAPIEYALLNGDEVSGVAVMKIVKEMDAGEIYEEREVLMRGSEGDLLTKEELYDIMGRLGGELVMGVVERLSGVNEIIVKHKRDEEGGGFELLDKNGEVLQNAIAQAGEVSFTKKISREMGEIDLSVKTAKEVFGEVLAYAGFPKSKLVIFGNKCVITQVKMTDFEIKWGEFRLNENVRIGDFIGVVKRVDDRIVVIGKRMFVLCADNNVLEIIKLYPEGKKEMDIAGFVNGYLK